MAAVLLSSFTVGVTQRDGRSYVNEDHVDQFGVHWPYEYLAAVGADYAALLALHADNVARAIERGELNAMLQTGALLTLKYVTKADLGNYFRAAYQAATREEACRLAKWLLDHIDAGDFTDAQVQAFFGLTTMQYNAMKARASTMRDNYNTMLSAVGE
jgi:hypothetical protein